MEVIVENVWTYLKQDNLDKELLREIESEMSYTVQEYVRHRKTYVDFEFSLLDRDELRYPTGLFSNLYSILSRHNLSYDLVDLRKKPSNSSKLQVHGKKFRDYQLETIEKAIATERGIIKIATGGGKTVIGAGIIADINVKTMFIVNSLDLLEQAYDEFTKMLQCEIGRVGGGYCDIHQINVCTIQTLHSALDLKYEAVDDECFIKERATKKIIERKEEIRELIESAEMIICDEVQHGKANSYVNMMKFAKSSYFKFGLSGTPYKYDSSDIILNAYSGKEIVSIDASYLIDRGFLVAPKIYVLDPNLLPGYKFIRGKKFQTIYKEWIVENQKRNEMIVDCAERMMELNKTTLITVTRIPHGENIMELLEKRLKGVKAAFIRGEVKKEDRKELLNSMRERDLKILVGTSLADEGLDIPALDSAIIAGGGKSLIKSLQRVGRTLRPYPSAEENIKKEAIIVDFFDHLRYLTGHAKKRIKIYKRESRFEIYEHF